MGRPTLELELDPKHARDLHAGGVFMPGCALEVYDECDLLVRGAGGELRLGARVVFVDPTGRGAGLEVIGFTPEMRQRIGEIAVPRSASAPAIPLPPTPPAAPSAASDDFEITEDVDEDAGDDISTGAVARMYLGPQSEPTFVGNPTQDFAAMELPGDVALDVPTEPRVALAASAPPPAPSFAPVIEPAAGLGFDDELELAPEEIRDVSAGSALDFPMDPSLASLQTFEIEPELDLAPPPRPTLTDLEPIGFDPQATQPIGLDESDDSFAGEDLAPEPALPGDVPDEAESTDPAADAADLAAAAEIAAHAPRLHERMRGLNVAQQLKYAHTGEMQERILLERIYGKTVWEALLRNPRITGPEVARIARMGALPRPLIEQIVGNGGWLQVPEVRRALLSHPRLTPDQIMRVLRLLPKHELKLATTQTAYSTAVREHARRMLR